MTDIVALKVEVRNTRMIDDADTARAERIVAGINELAKEQRALFTDNRDLQWKRARLLIEADRLRKRLEKAHKSRGQAQRIIGKLLMRLEGADDPTSDCTPFQSAAFTRGESWGHAAVLMRIEETLDGKDTGTGVYGSRDLERVRRRLLALMKLPEKAFREGATLYEDYDPGLTQDEAWNQSAVKKALSNHYDEFRKANQPTKENP